MTRVRENARYKSEMTREKIWDGCQIVIFYSMLFGMVIADVTLYSFLGHYILLNAVILVCTACIASYIIVPTERPNQIMACKRNLFLYLGGLLGAYLIIMKMNAIDASELGVSLGLNTGQTQSNAAQGWITMAVQFTMIGAPITFIAYEIKRIWTYYYPGFGHVTKRKRIEQLQRLVK